MLRIKEIAKRKGLTMQDVAYRIGVTPSSLSQIINGNPTYEKLKDIAKALDCEIQELFPVGKNYIHLYEGTEWFGIHRKYIDQSK